MAVEALTQWITSRSFQSSKNIADEYIESIQNNPARLDTVNTSLRKYNQALVYCQQGSYDLAIIQLKRCCRSMANFWTHIFFWLFSI